MKACNLRAWMCAITMLFISCSADSTQRVSQGRQPQGQLDSQSSGSAPAWLDELNRLRKTGGLEPVAENSALSRDCKAHAQYLAEQGPATEPQLESYKA